MTVREQAERLWANLIKLGPRRLAALGLIGLTVFLVTGVGGYYLSRPAQEVLYSGLDRQDITRIGLVLKDADIPFDVSADGTTVMVRYGQSAQARMLLAEKGLPHNVNGGYELFDKLGSLGLTSFMQGVTRVRALEGELARTIQSMRGVKAARVHLVMSDEGSYRRTRQPASASVVIRTDSPQDAASAKAIRHLVAAAVPGMTVDEVTVLNTDGVLLGSGNDLADAAPGRMLSLEKIVSQEFGDNIRKTLMPYLGANNFQVSVATRLNTDKKQTAETIYNPESRVERSIRTMKQNQVSQNSTTQSPATVERNLPQERVRADDGKQSNEENQKREELTNYEVSSKTVTTVSNGYSIDNISVAVLVNKASLGGDKATKESLEKQVVELEELISSAVGIHKDRGDSVKVSVVDFIDANRDFEPIPPPSITELLIRQSGNVVNAATILIVALLLIWFGLRPATRALLAQSEPAIPALADLPRFDEAFMPEPATADFLPQMGGATFDEPNLIEDLTSVPRRSPQKRLEQIVEFDEGHAAAVLKQWLHEGERA
jgi:flagellar M-ring protein FliF